MAEQHDSSLIGFDPLAWLVQEPTAAEFELNPPLQADPEALTETLETPSQDQSLSEIVTISPADTDDLYTLSDTMTETSASTLGSTALALEAQVSIQHVAQLHQRLVSALQNHHSIDIDASAVTSIDTASLQLLVILKQTALQEQKSVAIDFPSEAFIAAAKLLGLSELLDVDQPASGLF